MVRSGQRRGSRAGKTLLRFRGRLTVCPTEFVSAHLIAVAEIQIINQILPRRPRSVKGHIPPRTASEDQLTQPSTLWKWRTRNGKRRPPEKPGKRLKTAANYLDVVAPAEVSQ